MKCTFEKKAALDFVKAAVRYVDSRSNYTALKSLWLEAKDESLLVSSSDGSLCYAASVSASLVESGCVGVDAKTFYSLLSKSRDGSISLEREGDTLIIKPAGGRAKYSLAVSGSEHYVPPLSFPQDSQAVVVNSNLFRAIFDRVLFSVDESLQGEGISCLHLRRLDAGGLDVGEAVGLDGHQFSELRFEDSFASLLPDEGLLVLKKYATEVSSWLPSSYDLEVAVSDKRLFFRDPETGESLNVPLQAYSYPNYAGFVSRVSDDSPCDTIRVDRLELLDALGRVRIFNTEESRGVFFSLSGKQISLSAQSANCGTASESLACTFEGALEEICFPTSQLMNILSRFSSPEVELRISGREAPCGVFGLDDSDNNYFCIVMPMIPPTNEASWDKAA